MSVLTAGEIYLHVKAIFGSKKVKKYGVLHGKSPDSHPYLDLFDSSEDYKKHILGKKCDFKQVDLHHIKKISNETINGSKGLEYHIEIQTKKEKVVLMVDSELESQEWSSKFNGLCLDRHDENSTSSALSTLNDYDEDEEEECVTVNQMYGGAGEVERFEVDVGKTDLAQMCNIVGQRTLMVTPTCMAFENNATKQVDFTFQISWLRRFGKKENKFSLEVGRKCPNGAGEVKIHSSSAKAIHDIVSLHSKSHSKTVIPAESKGISAAKNNVQHVIEKKIDNREITKNSLISGPAAIPISGRQHPGLKDSAPKLIPLQNREIENESPSPKVDIESKGRHSTKSIGGESINGEKSGSIKQGPASEHFSKKLENQIAEKESVKLKEKERDARRKELERKKEEKENKKREEKERKEREKREKKEQKEKAKKDEKKGKEKFQHPPARVPGAYEDVDIIDQNPSPKEAPKVRPKISNYEDPDIQNDEMYSEADQLPPSEPVEYAQPLKKQSHVPCEYSDVKTVKGNAWQSYGRAEDEEQHTEDYSGIKSVREELGKSAPPLPVRGYDEDDNDDETYNRISLKTSKNIKQVRETQNIYGTASGTKVRPIKGVQIPAPDYNDSDSGESIQDNTYDTPDFDTYDSPVDPVQPKKPVESYEEAKPKARVSPRRVHEESLYDEVS